MYRCSCGCKFSLLWDQKCPGVGLLGPMWLHLVYKTLFCREVVSLHVHQQCMNDPRFLCIMFCLTFYLICFLFVFSVSYSFSSLLSPSCELLQHFMIPFWFVFYLWVYLSVCFLWWISPHYSLFCLDLFPLPTHKCCCFECRTVL